MDRKKPYTKRKERAPRRTNMQIEHDEAVKDVQKDETLRTVAELARADAADAYREIAILTEYEKDINGDPTSPSIRALQELEAKLFIGVNEELEMMFNEDLHGRKWSKLFK